MLLSTEYLIIIDKAKTDAFYALCNDKEGFFKLLQDGTDIHVDDPVLIFRNDRKYAFEIKTNTIGGKDQRFFHLRIVFDGNDDEVELDQYAKLLRAIREKIRRSNGQIETLWDDISCHYSSRAYPLIHQVENLMRKLITYFMLTNVGTGWVTEASPDAFQQAIDKSKRKDYFDVLHQTDFSDLGNFLFKRYQPKDASKLYDEIDKAQKLDDLKLEDLKLRVPKSNWERYFSKVVQCSDEYLSKKWEQLYDLRCKVAHNALLNKAEYEQIKQLVIDLQGHLLEAINNLDKVHVPQADREQVIQSVAGNYSTSLENLLMKWPLLEAEINRLYRCIFPEQPNVILIPLMSKVLCIRTLSFINDTTFDAFVGLSGFKNKLESPAGKLVSEETILHAIDIFEAILHQLRSIVPADKDWLGLLNEILADDDQLRLPTST